MKNLGKVRNFRAAAMINCIKIVTKFRRRFFFREHLDFGTKIEKYKTNFKRRLFFREHHDFRKKFSLRPRIRECFVLSVKY